MSRSCLLTSVYFHTEKLLIFYILMQLNTVPLLNFPRKPLHHFEAKHSSPLFIYISSHYCKTFSNKNQMYILLRGVFSTNLNNPKTSHYLKWFTKISMHIRTYENVCVSSFGLHYFIRDFLINCYVFSHSCIPEVIFGHHSSIFFEQSPSIHSRAFVWKY